MTPKATTTTAAWSPPRPFAKIADWSLRMLGVLPDKIAKSGEIGLVADSALFEDNDSAGAPPHEPPEETE